MESVNFDYIFSSPVSLVAHGGVPRKISPNFLFSNRFPTTMHRSSVETESGTYNGFVRTVLFFGGEVANELDDSFKHLPR